MAEREQRRTTPASVLRGVRSGVVSFVVVYGVTLALRYGLLRGLLRFIGGTVSLPNYRALAVASGIAGCLWGYGAMRRARSYVVAADLAHSNIHRGDTRTVRPRLVRGGGLGGSPASVNAVRRWSDVAPGWGDADPGEVVSDDAV